MDIQTQQSPSSISDQFLVLVLLVCALLLLRDIAETKTRTADAKQRTAELELVRRLSDGSYFSSIEDLWGMKQKSFGGVTVNIFERSEFVSIDNCYRDTDLGAADSEMGLVENPLESSICDRNTLDVFGNPTGVNQATHLMPLDKKCSSFWFHLVPWVLPIKNNANWKYEQKCIHGSIKSIKAGKETNIIQSSPLVPHESSLMDQESQTKQTEVPNVGIKHFRSNQIRLADHRHYFDNIPCILIVPILDVESVKRWDGESYDARMAKVMMPSF
jgi:hypothetical protein